jgi:hypothetical protein
MLSAYHSSTALDGWCFDEEDAALDRSARLVVGMNLHSDLEVCTAVRAKDGI